MKIVFKVSLPEQKEIIMYLSEDEFFIKEFNERVNITTSYEDRFNSLLSMFMLKNEWSTTNDNDYFYQVMFENNGVEEMYSFKDVPDNFYMFMGYFGKLADEL